MKTTPLLIASLVALSSTAALADQVGDCPHPVKPPARPPARKKPPVVPKRPPAVEKRCDCPPGPRGPEGPRGRDGLIRIEQTVDVIQVPVEAGLTLRLGVMGSLYGPGHSYVTRHGDWAWGPALELEAPLRGRDHLLVEVGLADLATANRDSGVLARVAIDHPVRRHLSVVGGLHLTKIDADVDGRYVALTLGLAARLGRLRAEVAPALGLLGEDPSGFRHNLQLGLTGQVGAGWSW